MVFFMCWRSQYLKNFFSIWLRVLFLSIKSKQVRTLSPFGETLVFALRNSLDIKYRITWNCYFRQLQTTLRLWVQYQAIGPLHYWNQGKSIMWKIHNFIWFAKRINSELSQLLMVKTPNNINQTPVNTCQNGVFYVLAKPTFEKFLHRFGFWF